MLVSIHEHHEHWDPEKVLQFYRYVSVASAAFYAWDYLLTFRYEVDNIWGGKMTRFRISFLLNRYVALFAVLFQNFLNFFQTGTSAAECRLGAVTYVCIMIIVANVGMVLHQRVCAIYNYRNDIVWAIGAAYTVVLALFLMLGIAQITVMFEGVHFVNGFCKLHLPHSATTLAFYFWVPVMIFDFSLTVLAVSKAIQHVIETNHKEWPAVRLLRVLARDSFVYFVINFLVYLNCTIQAKTGTMHSLQITYALVLVIPPVTITRMYMSMDRTVNYCLTVHDGDESIDGSVITMVDLPPSPVRARTRSVIFPRFYRSNPTGK